MPHVKFTDLAKEIGAVRAAPGKIAPDSLIHELILATAGIGMFLAALAPANAGGRGTRADPPYEHRSKAPPPAYAADPPAKAALDPPGSGCFVTYAPTEAVRGIRHWRPMC